MRSFMLLLALGLVSTDKLDRRYLPPPGSKFSGGSPGDLQVPLEYPKEAYTTTAPFTPGRQGILSPEDTRLTPGIDRGTGLPGFPEPSKNLNVVSATNKPPFNYYSKVPTTTTSYAFTQTTTFPPPEGFETTISPLGQVYSTDGSFSEQPGLNYPQLISQGEGYNQQINNQGQPGLFQPGTQIRPGGLVPTPGSNISGSQPGGHVSGHPGYNYNQPQSQYQQGLPSSTVSPIPGSSIQPGLTTPYGQSYTQHLGVQPPRQFEQQGYPSSTTTLNYQTGVPDQFNNVGRPQGVIIPGSDILQQSGQRPLSSGQSPFSPTVGPQSTDQYIDNFGNVQRVTSPGSISTKQVEGQRPQSGSQQTFSQPGSTQYGGDLNSLQGVVNPNLQEGAQRPQFIGQQGTFPSNIGPNAPVQGPSTSISQGFVQPGSVTTQPGQQPQITGQPDSFSSTLTPQGYQSTYQPGTTQSGRDSLPNTISGLLGQKLLPNQQTIFGNQPGNQQNISPHSPIQNDGMEMQSDGRFSSQQVPSQTPGDINSIGGGLQNIYRPDSSVSSTVGPSGYNQPTSPTSSSIPSYSTPGNAYSPSSSPYPGTTNQGNVPSINLQSRPERPQAESDRNAIILNYENVRTPEGYAYSYDTSNGIHADENGTAIDGVKAKGSYSYIGDDGKLYSVYYSADENGFRPYGDHLPTPPPVPAAIQRIIDHAAREKEAGISHDGSYDEAKYGHNKYQRPKNRRPQIQDRIIANGADIPDDYESNFDVKEGKKKFGSQDGRKPIVPLDSDSSNEDEGEEIIDEDKKFSVNDNKRPSGKQPQRRPSNIKPEPGYYNQNDKENSYTQENKKQQPIRPITDIRNQFATDRKDANKQRPLQPGRKDKPVSPKDRYEDEELITGNNNSDETDEKYYEDDKIPSKADSESEEREDTPGRFVSNQESIYRKPGRRPSTSSSYYSDSGKPKKPMKGSLKPFGTKYSVSDDNAEDYYEEPVAPGEPDQNENRRPQGSKNPVGSGTRYKQINKQQPGTTIENQRFDNIDGSRFDQNKQRPSFTQRIEGDIKYPQQQLDEETGYQYTPPQSEFNQDNRFPSRLSDKVQGSTTKRPTTKYHKGTTIKPFMTPNVYRQEDDSYEDESKERYPSSKPGKITSMPTTLDDEYETTDDGPEYYDKDTDFDQDIGDDVNTSNKIRPNKPSSSLGHPSYTSQQKTSRPQYDQYTPNNRDKVSQKGPSRPGQKGYDRQQTQGRRPAGQSSTRPGFNLMSTTPMPFRTSTRKDSERPQSYYQQDKLQYPTTYHPSDTSSTEEDYDRTTSPGYSSTDSTSRRPGSYSETVAPTSLTRPGSTRVPSSRPTSSPELDYSDRTTMPGSTTIISGSSGPSYSQPSSITVQLGSTINQFGRPMTPGDRYFNQNQPSTQAPGRNDYTDSTLPGSVATRPGEKPKLPGQTQDLPSTTYRPNYSFPNNEPTTSVDGFGRPINQPGVGVTRVPGSLVTSQETGLPSTAIYQDSGIGRPGQQIRPTFKPSETRFGQPELLGPSPTSLGQKPAEFGPSDVTVPTYLGPYPSSTERVIGEDFSGPKQPQRYDPATGYHY